MTNTKKSYSYFIRENNLPDNRDSYEAWVRKSMNLPECLIKAQVENGYNGRFA